MTESPHEPIRPIANIGDLVSVKGYGIRTFQVDAFSHEFHYDAENVSEEIYYDVTCTTTLEYLLADQSAIAVVSRAAGAPQYLQANVKRPQATAHVPTTDELLDELSDALALKEMFGEPGNPDGDLSYALRVDEIKAKLRDLTKTYTWGG